MTTATKSKITNDKHKMSEIDENISKLFDIKKRLGKGAYGIVWKALEKRTNETLAVKKIFDAFRDETDAQRTFREIVFLKAFRNHPNIIKLHSVFKATNNLDIYLIFEYMESDLHNIIKKGTILKDIHKRYVMYQLINAIKYIHSGNVIHRDLKPSNVLIDSKCRCKLADFGLARSVSNRPIRESLDKGNDIPPEPILTDYVATRWYRAPEILVASKRYTKGIDMWSLGCILGEMLRGKPLFQGSSTVNQIEKIVSALPEITEQDINAVGAGFGSVLLSKQISRDKKTPLNDLLHDASRDALDLVKSLLVLDPLGRLTAKQALNHPYVEKFRNSIPELELNVDILPPFRDDVRLSVPEYRSKLYEIVQVAAEKKSYLRCNDYSKHRDQMLPNRAEKSSSKKNSKSKHILSMEEKLIVKSENNEMETHQKMGNLNSTINRGLKKSSSALPGTKCNQSKTSLKSITPFENGNCQTRHIESAVDERILKRSKSHGQHSLKGQMESITRFNSHDIKSQTIIPTSVMIVHPVDDDKHRLHKSLTLLRTADGGGLCGTEGNNNDQNNQNHLAVMKGTQLDRNKICLVRNSKSDVIAFKKNAETITLPDSNRGHCKTQDRICYERRLKKLEEEIERYKKEVKTFCRQTFNNTNTNSHSNKDVRRQTSQDNLINKQSVINCEIPLKKNTSNMNGTTTMSGNVPIKTTYFQLLTKGHHREHYENKSDIDLSANSGAGSGSDHLLLRQHCNTANSCSDKSNNNNNAAKQHQLHQQITHQYRSRPISKFV